MGHAARALIPRLPFGCCMVTDPKQSESLTHDALSFSGGCMCIHPPFQAAALPCTVQVLLPACQKSDWKAHKVQCVGQNTVSPAASQTDGTERQPASGEGAPSSQGDHSAPDRTRRQPATGAAGASRSSGFTSSRQIDPQLSASLLQTLMEQGLVPVTPGNEGGWFEMISRSFSGDVTVRRETIVNHQRSSPGLCFSHLH